MSKFMAKLQQIVNGVPQQTYAPTTLPPMSSTTTGQGPWDFGAGPGDFQIVPPGVEITWLDHLGNPIPVAPQTNPPHSVHEMSVAIVVPLTQFQGAHLKLLRVVLRCLFGQYGTRVYLNGRSYTAPPDEAEAEALQILMADAELLAPREAITRTVVPAHR